MNDVAIVSVIAMLGWLVLAGGALASFQLSWGKTVQLILIWACIFTGAFLAANLMGLEL